MKETIERHFPSRFDAVDTLCGPIEVGTGETLRAIAVRLRSAAEELGSVPGASDWSAFASAVEICAQLADWQTAAFAAETDADRYLRAARLRFEQWSASDLREGYETDLVQRLDKIGGSLAVSDVAGVLASAASLSLPLVIFANPKSSFSRPWTPVDRDERAKLAVAFLEFRIDGEEAATIHALRANQLHDLDLKVRVSSWPAGATSLTISPISIEPCSAWDLPTFDIPAPSGSPPYVFERRGRMVLHAAQGLNSRPLEFQYAAEFQPPTSDQPVVVAGQRLLRIDGADPALNPVTGWPDIDAKLLAIRNSLRSDPLVSETELTDLLRVLTPIASRMGQAVHRGIYSTGISEAAFQADIVAMLHDRPEIGPELEEQPEVAGGRTDLSYRGIRIELKSEQKKRLVPKDCERFASQASSYAAGTGKRVAVLAVLDCSPKKEAPFALGDGLFDIRVSNGTAPIHVITCLFQGGLPKPSALSR